MLVTCPPFTVSVRPSTSQSHNIRSSSCCWIAHRNSSSSDWCVFIFNPLKDPNYFVVPLSTWVGLAQQRSFKWTDQQVLLFFSFSGGCTKLDILFQQESIPSCVALWNRVTEEKTCRRAFRKQTDISRHPEALLTSGRQAGIHHRHNSIAGVPPSFS